MDNVPVSHKIAQLGSHIIMNETMGFRISNSHNGRPALNPCSVTGRLEKPSLAPPKLSWKLILHRWVEILGGMFPDTPARSSMKA